MATPTNVTPSRKLMSGINAPLLENNIRENLNRKISKQSLIWGSINICILSVILYDVLFTCTRYMTYVQYVEYLFILILTFNAVYHFGRYLRINISNKYLGNNEYDPVASNLTPVTLNTSVNNSVLTTPMNTSAVSWMSNTSHNDSQNYPVQSRSWIYSHGSPASPQQQVSPVKTSLRDTSGVDFITDENTLNTYLKDFETNEKVANISNPLEQPANILSTFWNHPIAKNTKEVASFLKKCQYQLSTSTTTVPYSPYLLSPSDFPNYYYGEFPRPYQLLNGIHTYDLLELALKCAHLLASSSNSPKSDDKSSPLNSQPLGMEPWRRLNIDSVVLTQWNANIRMWISQTILDRLINEFRNIDEALQKQAIGDVEIGKVGLDRLRKTAQTVPVLQFIPTLPSVIPFLELTPNQEYLVDRIRQLAKGGCMSEFKWNSGSSYNGKDWEPSLPTDSAIIMHLFATYLDTQLMPLPSQPDTKPFTGYHLIKAGEKLPTLTDSTLAIQQVTEYPPHYRVIIGEEIHELVKGYNNLFHSILLFLHYVNKKEHGMLGRVNLGRSGVNMLWIIQS